jgi:hypothetical protein
VIVSTAVEVDKGPVAPVAVIPVVLVPP